MTETTGIYLLSISLFILLYAYLGYPLLIWLGERIFFQPVKKEAIEPAITIIVTTYNEETNIAAKLDNLLALDYPEEKMQIIVADDGSSDKTVEIAANYANLGVKLHQHPIRRGKAATLNDEVPRCQTEIVVLVDCRQRLEAQSLRKLISNFADTKTGAASGELVFAKPQQEGISRGMNFYWKYEKFIRHCESGIHSTVGATGALLAFRKQLWLGLPANTVLDDMVLPFQIIRQGKRVVLEEEAIVHDTAAESWEKEFIRKTRTLGGNFQVLFHMPSMGIPLFSPITFQFFSHKLMRLLGPLALIGMFWSSYWLFRIAHYRHDNYGIGSYGILLVLQGLLYLSAGLGYSAERLRLRLPLIHIGYSFILTQITIVCGLLRFTSGRDDSKWEKSQHYESGKLHSRIIRLFADSTIFCFGIVLAFYLRYWGKPPEHIFLLFSGLNPVFNIGAIKLAIPLIMLVPLSVFYFFRIQERATAEVNPEFVLKIFSALFFSTIFTMLLIYNMRDSLTIAYKGKVTSFPTAVLAISFLVNCLAIAGWRLLWKYIRYTQLPPEERRGTVVVSGNKFDSRISKSLEQEAALLTRITGTVGPISQTNLPHLGSIYDAINNPDLFQPDNMLLCSGELQTKETLQLLAAADKNSIPAAITPGSLDLLLGGIRLRLLSYIPVLNLQTAEHNEVSIIIKRICDLCAGSFLLLTGLPGLAIYLLKHGFRVSGTTKFGKNCQKIRLFRPVFVAASANKVWWKLTRCFFLGYHLLKGDLALIGPPALTLRSYAKASALEKSFLTMRPGLWGPHRLFISCQSRINKNFIPALYYSRFFHLGLDLALIIQFGKKLRQRRL